MDKIVIFYWISALFLKSIFYILSVTYRWTFWARFNNLFAKSKFLFNGSKNEATVLNFLNKGISKGVDLILVDGNLEQVAPFLPQVWLNILIESRITLHLSIVGISPWFGTYMEAMNSSPRSQWLYLKNWGVRKKSAIGFLFGLKIYQKVSIWEHFVFVFLALEMINQASENGWFFLNPATLIDLTGPKTL